MELWNRNVYIALNGKLQNLETKQIKSHVFSYVFLTSIAICVIINLDMFYDTLDQLRHLIYHSLVRNRDKPYFEKGAITLFWVVILILTN